MNKERPMLVTLIGDMWSLAALLFIVPVFISFENSTIVKYQELPGYYNIPELNENASRIIIFMIIAMISFLYLNMKRSGYLLMLGLYIYSIIMQYMFDNVVPIVLIMGLIFFIPTYKYYKK